MQEPELEPAAVKLDAGSATASFEPLDAAAAPIAEPPDLHKHPILEQWEYNSAGSISGRVYGKKGFNEGKEMTTSIVPEKTRFATYVITGSGSIYRLGEKAPPAEKYFKGLDIPVRALSLPRLRHPRTPGPRPLHELDPSEC